MKKKLCSLLLALIFLASNVNIATAKVSRYPNGFRNGINIRGINVLSSYAGNVFWVDSGSGSNGYTGKSPTEAFATLDYAIGRCTANNGDIIMVAPGHAETMGGTADSVDADVAGIAIIGLGSGVDMPEFNYDTVTDEFVIGAANVTIHNLRFVAGISAITMGISVEAAGDNITISKCEFPEPTTSTFEFIDAIDLASGADSVKIYDCTYYNADATGSTHFLDAGNGVNNDLQVVGNLIYGEFSVSAIWSDTIDLEVLIKDNIITNMTTGQHCIEFTDAATGMCVGNKLYTDTEATTLDPGSIKCIENYAAVAIDASGYLVPTDPVRDALFGGTGVVTYPAAAVPANGVSMAEVLRSAWDALRNGTGGAEPGTNRSILNEIPGSPNYNRLNYFTVTPDFTSATWNTVAAHEIVTVTGAVRLRILAECTETLVGATATIELGTANNTAEIIAQANGTDIDNLDIWRSATPDVEVTAYADSIRDYVVVGGTDVGYTIGTAALTDGTIIFHIWWEPLDSTGAAAAGAGGAL